MLPNSEFELPRGVGGPRLAAAWASWPAAQLNRKASQEPIMPTFLRIAALLMSSMSAGLLASCASQQPLESVEQYISEQSRQWTDAYVTGNTDVVDRILATDFVGTSLNGRRFTKQDAIKEVRDGPNNFASNQLSKIEVRVYGSTALAFGQDVMRLKSNPAVEETAAWTDTWLLRSGKWQVVASHESKVPRPHAAGRNLAPTLGDMTGLALK